MDFENKDAWVLFIGCGEKVSLSCTDRCSAINSNPSFLRSEDAEKAKKTLLEKFGEDKVKMALSGTWR